MYHYVRDREGARFPEIKGLTRAEFKGQLGYIKKHYQVISAIDLLHAILDQKELPSNAALLTFDDGYDDHFTNVLPVLLEEQVTGCFFIPARTVLNAAVLDVNKIHFILAAVPEKSLLVGKINLKVNQERSRFQLEPVGSYWERLAKASRFDPPEVIYIKRMLQRELPPALRDELVNELFSIYVTKDEPGFSRELYMDRERIQTMVENGMYIGSHGNDHLWLNRLSEPDQEREIAASLEFLHSLNIDTTQWMMCYPHGGWNDSLLGVLRRFGCAAGLTTRIEIADLSSDIPLTLPRLDANDLPKDADAPRVDWTKRVYA